MLGATRAILLSVYSLNLGYNSRILQMETAGSPAADGSPAASAGHAGAMFDGAEIARRYGTGS